MRESRAVPQCWNYLWEFICGQEGARSAAPLDNEKGWQRFVGCFVLAGSDRKSFQTHHGSQDLPVGQEVTATGLQEGDARATEDFPLELRVKNVV